MASKRAVRRKVCARKVRYTNEHEAVAAIRRLRHRRDGPLTTYSCRFCGGFHFGHPPAHVRRAMLGVRE